MNELTELADLLMSDSLVSLSATNVQSSPLNINQRGNMVLKCFSSVNVKYIGKGTFRRAWEINE